MFTGSVSIFKSTYDPTTNAPVPNTQAHVQDENNSLFLSASGIMHTHAAGEVLNGAAIVWYPSDIPYLNSDFHTAVWDYNGRIGQVQTGMVTPTLELDSESKPVVIIHNRFTPPATGQREFSQLGLATPWSGNNMYARSYVRLQTPCIQTSTEILDVYYRIRVDDTYVGNITTSIQYLIGLFGNSLNLTRFPIRYWTQDSLTRQLIGNAQNHAVSPFKHHDSNQSYWTGVVTRPYLDTSGLGRFRNFSVATGLMVNNMDHAQPDAIGKIFKTIYPTAADGRIGYGTKPQVIQSSDDPVQGVFINTSSSDTPFLGSLGESNIRMAVSAPGFDKDGFNHTYVLQFTDSGRINGEAKYRLSVLKNLGFNQNTFGGEVIDAPLNAFHYVNRISRNGVDTWTPHMRNGGKWYGAAEGSSIAADQVTQIDSKSVVTWRQGQAGITIINVFTGQYWDYDSDNGLAVSNIRAVACWGDIIYVACLTSGLWRIDLAQSEVSQLRDVGCFSVTTSNDGYYFAGYLDKCEIRDPAGVLYKNLAFDRPVDVNYLYRTDSLTPLMAKLASVTNVAASATDAYNAWCTELGLVPDVNIGGMSNAPGWAAVRSGVLPFATFGSTLPVRFHHTAQGALGFYVDLDSLPSSTTNTGAYDAGAFRVPELYWATNTAPALMVLMGNPQQYSTSEGCKYNASEAGAVFFMRHLSSGHSIDVAIRILPSGRMDVVCTPTSGESNRVQLLTSNQNTSRTMFGSSGVELPVFVGQTSSFNNANAPAVSPPYDLNTNFYVSNPNMSNYQGKVRSIGICPRDKDKAFVLIEDTATLVRMFVVDVRDSTIRGQSSYNKRFDEQYDNPKFRRWAQYADGDEVLYYIEGRVSETEWYVRHLNKISWNRQQHSRASYGYINETTGLMFVKDSNGDERPLYWDSGSMTIHVDGTGGFNSWTTQTYWTYSNTTITRRPMLHMGNGIWLSSSSDTYSAYLSLMQSPQSFRATNNLAKMQWEHYGWESGQWVLGSNTPKVCHAEQQPLVYGTMVGFVSPNGVESVVAGEYVVFSVCDGILKDNASTLKYTTTFGAGSYVDMTEEDLSSPIVPAFATTIVSDKVARNVSYVLNADNNTIVNSRWGEFIYGDFTVDAWPLGRYLGALMSSVSGNAHKHSFACDYLDGDFTFETTVIQHTGNPWGYSNAYFRFGFVPTSRPLTAGLWGANSISWQIYPNDASNTGIYVGTEWVRVSNGHPRMSNGDRLRISRTGTVWKVENLTAGTEWVRDVPELAGAVRLLITNRDSRSEWILDDMRISYTTPQPLVAVGKAISQSGRYAPEFTGLAYVTELELDGAAAEIIHDGIDNPTAGQVIVYKSGYLRFHPDDAGKTITKFRGAICRKYY